jgi:uncharacterized membrane protein HdeD (DUF308 family)
MPTPHNDKEPKSTMSQTFFRACCFILLGIVAIWLALELLARLWGWLILIAAVVGIIWAAVAYLKWRRNRW